MLIVLLAAGAPAQRIPSIETIRIGIIGLDTSHSVRFTELINDPAAEGLFARYEVVAAYPYGSRTIESSYSRIPEYSKEIQQLGVEIVDSIADLLDRVDVVMLETNDGNIHLEQALQVIESGKPLFIDKPLAASLEDVLAIFAAAEDAGIPIFSSSSLRFMKSAQEIRNGSIGEVQGAFAYSPAMLEPTHTDLYWYGIHGVEILFTVLGTGCESVVRVHTDGADVVTGTWTDGRIGTFHGMRDGSHGYGGTAFGGEKIAEIGPYEGYRPLVESILKFFDSDVAPVAPEETIEIYAFMAAADESKQLGGVPVRLADVLDRARARMTGAEP
jgi:predicted dehydrogenase